MTATEDFIDDINGWDSTGNDSDPSPTLVRSMESLGTMTTTAPPLQACHRAGQQFARGDGKLLPNCSLMVLRGLGNRQDEADAFGYAQQMGADIITNSWGYPIGTPTTNNIVNAINAAATGGRAAWAAWYCLP